MTATMWRKRGPEWPDAIPTMVSPQEQGYLVWLGANVWKDRGHVLEIGPWLGGSTRCLAAGMRESHAAPRHALHVVDNFRWREFMERYAPLGLAPGASFEPHFRRHVARYGELVVSHVQALPDETIAVDELADVTRAKSAESDPPFAWDPAAKIEILFIDGAKSWRGMRHLLATVQPALTPGESLLVAQDYKHWGAYWVPLFLQRMSDALELVHVVVRGSTVTFRLARPIDAARIAALPDHVRALSLDEASRDLDAAARALEALGDDVGGAQVRLGEAMLALHRGELDRAVAVYAKTCRAWPRGAKSHALEQAFERLAKSGVVAVQSPPRASKLARLGRRLSGRD